MSSITIDGKIIELSNEEKILFPRSGITKGDLISYYQKIAPLAVPLIKNHPLAMNRFPNGITAEGFYQKDIPDYFPSWIARKAIAHKEEKKTTTYVVCNNNATLVYLANQGVITPHMWLSTTNKLDYPDRIVFDLDPSIENDFKRIKQGAKLLKKILELIGLHPFVMTTGSRGLHVTVPIKQTASFEHVKKFATAIAQEVIAQHPHSFTIDIRKEVRGDRIFIDTLRNRFAQLAVIPYAVRPKEGAPIATPLDWEELNNQKLQPQSYNIKNIFKRLAQKENPWKNFYANAEALPLK